MRIELSGGEGEGGDVGGLGRARCLQGFAPVSDDITLWRTPVCHISWLAESKACILPTA